MSVLKKGLAVAYSNRKRKEKLLVPANSGKIPYNMTGKWLQVDGYFVASTSFVDLQDVNPVMNFLTTVNCKRIKI